MFDDTDLDDSVDEVSLPDKDVEDDQQESAINSFVHFELLDKESEPVLKFEGSYDPKKLEASAVDVIQKLKERKTDPAKINDFLQRVCMAFGLPTSIANASNVDDVLNTIGDVADSLTQFDIQSPTVANHFTADE